MQESPDGCEISQAYLSLFSCLQYIKDCEIDEGLPQINHMELSSDLDEHSKRLKKEPSS